MQQTFTSSTAWTMTHPWGSTHPYVIATNEDGSRTYLVGPEFTDGQVTVTFGRPTAGVLELLNPSGVGAALADNLVAPATIAARGTATVAAATTAATGQRGGTVRNTTSAVIAPGKGAVIR